MKGVLLLLVSVFWLSACHEDVNFATNLQLAATVTPTEAPTSAAPTVTPTPVGTAVATSVAPSVTPAGVSGQSAIPPIQAPPPLAPAISPIAPVATLPALASGTVVPFSLGFGNLSNHGVSALGLCSPQFDCDSFLEIFEKVPLILTGWLDNTFAEDCRCAERLLESPKPKVVRVHIANSSCLRNRRCGPYEIFFGETVRSANRKIVKGDPALLARFEKRWRVVNDLVRRAVNTRVLVSNCLECDLSAQARTLLNKRARPFFSDVEFVDNPAPRGGPCLSGIMCEHHPQAGENTGSGAEVVDTDGTDFFAIDPRRLSSANVPSLMILIWRPSFNGRGGTDKFIDPRARINFPTDADLRAARRWLEEPP